MKRLSPREIEATSMEIIDREAGAHHFSADEWKIVRRIIHATADFDIIKTVRFTVNALAAGVASLRGGYPVYTDTHMLAAAIQKRITTAWKCDMLCFVADKDVVQASKETGETRSVLAIRKAAPMLTGGIVAVGNAPTALHEAISLCEQGAIRPHLIIGMPVGFVEALESKERLFGSRLTCITNLDRKGGTPATAAAVHALHFIAESR